MTQANPVIGANKSGLVYRQEDNDGKQALLNHHKGATAPAYAESGTVWLDDAATPWLLKIHDGADWMICGSVNAATNQFIPYRDGSALGDAAIKTVGTSGPNLPSFDLLASEGFFCRNIIVNGDFRIGQRGTAFTSTTVPPNNDDTYTFDRWVLLSDGNNITDLAQDLSTIPPGSSAALRLDVKTANKKCGLLQIVETRQAEAIIGGAVSLSFKARKGSANATVDTLRAAVIAWSAGSDDLVTSDMISVWGAEGTNPILIAGATYENTPENLALTNSYQTFKIENIYLDTANTRNIAVLIWIDNGDGTVNDSVYISDVQLQLGANATEYEYLPAAVTEILCKRYFLRHQRLSGTAPVIGGGLATATAAARFIVPAPVKMRANPVVTAAGLSAIGNGASISLTTGDITAGQADANGVTIATGKTGFTANHSYALSLATGAANYVDFDAEL